ncbi:hypothetical protein PGT21_004023 [Puccinia graminis f. sp. tritici]|uniref:Uncharacterized protein n=1 Tax=Puccinia graminis f. sp. tritici TaxID=56615 RepID=A0A5B0LKQ3_PUCGR|nr:hypothetical protein PGT21_004023 [Puccinia graminis f. sp. tritici]KAA1128473.1 hypothetical protein PGTUg99_012548 [Puccinia graminis f. sp. tritici]
MKKTRNNEILVESSIPEHKAFPNFPTYQGKFNPLFLDGNVMIIDESILKAMIEKSKETLDALNSLKKRTSNIEICHAVSETQSLVFQQIDYMYKYGFISQHHFRYFLRMDNTLQIASENLIETSKIKYGSSSANIIFPSKKVIQRNRNFAHFRNFFKELEDREQRYFCFLTIKELMKYHKTQCIYFRQWSHIPFGDSIFDLLESRLEVRTQYPQGNNQNTPKEKVLGKWIEQKKLFSSIKHSFKGISTTDQILSYCLIEYHQENYGKIASKEGLKYLYPEEIIDYMSIIFQYTEKLKDIEIEVKEIISSKFLGRNCCHICNKPDKNKMYYHQAVLRISKALHSLTNSSPYHNIFHPTPYYLKTQFIVSTCSLQELIVNSIWECKHKELSEDL